MTGRQGRQNMIRTPEPKLLGEAQNVESPLKRWQLLFTSEMEETVVRTAI